MSISNNNTQLPVEVDERLKLAIKRKSLSQEYADGYKDGYIASPTEYATKLHQLQQENEKMKAMAIQWRPLLEEVLVMNEAWGDLPGGFIDKIKKFLYGE